MSKVRSIKGKHVPDVLRDADFARVAELQAVAWQAEQAAHVAAAELKRRILHGARIESAAYYWDEGLQMVRSRRAS